MHTVSTTLVKRTEDTLITDLLTQAVDHHKVVMNDKFLDSIISQVESRLISRILHEIYCLYEVDTIHKTAENVILSHLNNKLL